MCLRVSNAPGPYLARTLVPPPVHSVSVQTSECQHRDNVNPQVWSLQRVESEDPPRPGDTILDMDSAKKNRRRSAPASTSPAVTSLNTTKSPAPALAIKRSDTAPVTLRGWLYKQGSCLCALSVFMHTGLPLKPCWVLSSKTSEKCSKILPKGKTEEI